MKRKPRTCFTEGPRVNPTSHTDYFSILVTSVVSVVIVSLFTVGRAVGTVVEIPTFQTVFEVQG